MGAKSSIGEFEHLVLLAVMRLGQAAHAPAIAELLEDAANREVSRGALYSSLDRLERKGFLVWGLQTAAEAGRRPPKRLFTVTETGLEAVRRNHEAVLTLSRGIGPLLKRTSQ